MSTATNGNRYHVLHSILFKRWCECDIVDWLLFYVNKKTNDFDVFVFVFLIDLGIPFLAFKKKRGKAEKSISRSKLKMMNSQMHFSQQQSIQNTEWFYVTRMINLLYFCAFETSKQWKMRALEYQLNGMD